jgi:hypothetical protein
LNRERKKMFMDKPKIETINHPAHYGGDTMYEAIKVIEAWRLGFNLGQVLKYVRRFMAPYMLSTTQEMDQYKSKCLEDLKKARFYLDREILRLEYGYTKEGVTRTAQELPEELKKVFHADD